MNDVNRLWVHVSCFGEGNLFAVYPKLLAEMLAGAQDSAVGPPDFEFLLPSDIEWRRRIYYNLVEKQRAFVGMVLPSAFLDKPRLPGPWDTTLPQPPNKRPRRCTLINTATYSRESVSSSVAPVTWTVSDIAKAACLLKDPPITTDFNDEQEMRRVFSLIYDVFRYKNILTQALTDVSFFAIFPELHDNEHLIWLLLYDLYHRRFAERDQSDIDISDRLFPEYGLVSAETALWGTRIRLAAAMSRLRIANSALKLSDLLPPHLRDEKVARAAHLAPVTCWVNKNQAKTPETIFYEIKDYLELDILDSDSAAIGPSEFRWDPLCPMFLSFHYTQRSSLAQSIFVKNNILILQNRSFCFGPAIFCKMLFKHNLTGSVVQTHITSPRTTAYLATLLTENDQINSLLAFGAGDRKTEYEDYFRDLHIKNIKIYAKRLVEIEPTADILEHVVAVYVTPPNSYSAVNDPIDLVCSRGGDLAMLEILTDTEDSLEGQNRVASILEEQRLSLRFSMSRPQIQFVVYGTHSQLPAENGDMVKQVVQEVNRAAHYKHAELQGKLHHIYSSTKTNVTVTSDILEINNNELDMEKEIDLKLDEVFLLEQKVEIKESEVSIFSEAPSAVDNEDDPYKLIEVPPTDIFEQQPLPELCFNADKCLCLASEGCYLALVQRKVVTRCDAKYMIKMAEARGLFGYSNPENIRLLKVSKTAKKTKKETETASPVKRKRPAFEIDRINAATHSSMMRSCSYKLRAQNDGEPVFYCCRRHQMQEPNKVSPARQWWAETTRYLTRLRRALLKQKIVSAKPALLRVVKNEKILQDIHNIDEILARTEHKKGQNVPVFPKLRLSRHSIRVERDTFPVCVNLVELIDEDDELK